MSNVLLGGTQLYIAKWIKIKYNRLYNEIYLRKDYLNMGETNLRKSGYTLLEILIVFILIKLLVHVIIPLCSKIKIFCKWIISLYKETPSISKPESKN